MTNKITIGGIDVSECKFFYTSAIPVGNTDKKCGSRFGDKHCENNLDCYYKQLKRKEKECKALKLSENEAIEIIAELKEELKIVTAQSRHAEQTLDEIEEFIENPLIYVDENIYNNISNIINKAKDGE